MRLHILETSHPLLKAQHQAASLKLKRISRVPNQESPIPYLDSKISKLLNPYRVLDFGAPHTAGVARGYKYFAPTGQC